ncbi:MAG: PspC domain-containing protein [Actinomycetota bacterium]|nr:PspC domain-containing protein [Actinomycetota bacterium]
MTTTPQSLPSGTGLDRFFDTLRRSPVRRSPNHVIAGVCAGLALKLGVSVKVVRILAVVAALLGPALVLYLAAWLLLPDADGRVRLEQAIRGGETSSILLLVATLLVLVPDAGFRARVGWLVPLAVVGVVGWFLWSRRQRPVGADAPQSYGPHPTVPSAGTSYYTAPEGPAPEQPSLVKNPKGAAPQDSPPL